LQVFEVDHAGEVEGASEEVFGREVDRGAFEGRLTTPEKWREHQRRYSVARLTGEPSKGDYDYDWTFTEECDVHGALPDEI
jgi:hypothetical protein